MSSNEPSFQTFQELFEGPLGAVFIKNPEKQRKCPLCNRDLNLYSLKPKAMLLMCENLNCDFPFGYEAMQVVSNESELRDNPLPATEDFFMYPNDIFPLTVDTISTTSMVPTSTLLSDTEPPNLGSALGAAEVPSEDILSVRLKRESRQRQQRKVRAKETEKHLVNIKKMGDEILTLSSEEFDKNIKNEKWLKNLKIWQKSTNKKLLKEHEVKVLKRKEEKYSVGEIKCKYEPGARIPTVNIEIFKKK